MKIKKVNELNSDIIMFGEYELPKERILFKDKDFFIIYDGYPVSPGHILIITNGSELDYFSLSEMKKNKLNDMISISKQIIEKEYNPDGYNIGMNCGIAAGQSVMQFHCHLIPRYKGDVDNPKGGVRHSVIGKGFY